MSLTEHPSESGTGARPASRSIVLVFEGEVDLATAPTMKASIDTAILAGHTTVTVDLAEVSFFDSSGVEALWECQQHACRRGTSLKVRGARPNVQQVLRITGADRLLESR